MTRNIFALSAAILVAGVSFAQTSVFKVGGGTPAQQLATFESQTDFEAITGTSSAIKGSLSFDVKKKSGSGKITIQADSIKTGIDLRDEHLKGETWLDTAKYKEITFETTNVKSLGGDKYSVTGKFTMHGVTKTMTTTATVKHIKASDATKKANFKGDVLQVKTGFSLKLSDYGIKIAGPAASKVSNTLKISLAVYAQNG